MKMCQLAWEPEPDGVPVASLCICVQWHYLWPSKFSSWLQDEAWETVQIECLLPA
jgi:hypothetical protein